MTTQFVYEKAQNRMVEILTGIEPEDIDENGHFKVPDGIAVLDDECLRSDAKMNLRSIDLNSATIIGREVFIQCSELVTVIGAPTSIGDYAFGYCFNLRNIDLSNANTIGKYSFTGSDIEEINISRVKTVAQGAFLNCKSLKNVIGSPISIENSGFAYCYKLSRFDFSHTTSLSESAFAVSGLQEIDLRNVNDIYDNTFRDCKELIRVTGSPKYIGTRSFRGCEKLVSFDFSNTESIGVNAFEHCGFEEINIGNVNSISDRTFANCPNLQKIIGHSLKHIDDYAFLGSRQLTTVTLSELDSIGCNAFFRCGLSNIFSIMYNRVVKLNYDDNELYFVRISDSQVFYRIGDVVNVEKGVYIDATGSAFILNGNNKVYLHENKERFLELLETS